MSYNKCYSYIMASTLWQVHYGKYIMASTLWQVHYGKYIMATETVKCKNLFLILFKD